MKIKILYIFLGLEFFLCVLLGVQSIRYWLNPLKWGWQQEIKERSTILFIFVIIMLTLSVILIRTTKLGSTLKIVLSICLTISTLGIGLFIMLHLPKPPTSEQVLMREDYSPQDVSILTDCEKVDKFVAIGSHRLDIGNRSVLVPNWVHQSLESIPQDSLIDCFQSQMLIQESLIAIDSKDNEVPVQKLHALIFEANRLGILNDAELINQLRIVACNESIDYFGELTLQYYIVSNNTFPAYDYYSDEGKMKLHKEMCE